VPNQLVGQMHFLARFEADSSPRNDSNLGAGARITSDTGLTRPDIEDAETPQLNPVARAERTLQAVEDGIHCRFDLVPREAGALDHSLDDVLFDQ
jgi:hypothetical protein